MNKRLKGQVTVFASLVIVLVISVICAAIRSVSLSVAKTNINSACNLSIESIFGEYCKPLLEEFDILLLKNSSQLQVEIKRYIEENIKFSTGFTSEKLQSVDITEMVKATDNGGDVIKQEVLDYMKYGVLSEAAQLIIGSEQQVKKSEKTTELIEKINGCQEYRKSIDNIILKVITLVEGLDTDENGLVIKKEKPNPIDGHFVKELCIDTVNPTSTAVNNTMVYDVLSERYSNVLNIMTNMYAISSVIKENNLTEVERSHYLESFSLSYQDFRNLLDTSIQKSEEAIQVMEGYDSAINSITEQVNEIGQEVESNKVLLGDEVTKGFEEDLGDFRTYGGENSTAICNIPLMRDVLRNNLVILKQTRQSFNYIERNISYESSEQIMNGINQCIDLISQYDNHQLIFNYSGIDFSSDKEGLGRINNLIHTIKDGMLGFVIEDTSVISNKSIQYVDLASSQQNGKSGYWSNLTGEAKDNVIYNEYVMTKFKTYMDGFDSSNNRIQTEDPLDYSAEYILCGRKSDKENLESTILKLSLIRQGANLTYLLTDYEKKSESYALAISLLGFTGMPPIIKAGQYLIMTAWAYGESIMDMKKIFKGQKVELTKSKSNWQLSLNNLLSTNFNLAESTEDDNNKGLDYKGYLRLLMYMENPIDKYYQTMDCIELRMIGKGFENFRLKDYIYSINASAAFSINRGIAFYSQDFKYQY